MPVSSSADDRETSLARVAPQQGATHGIAEYAATSAT
jgi:hypothetical protein